jgi:Zn-dependent M28 family amino/carboxypeptidase
MFESISTSTGPNWKVRIVGAAVAAAMAWGLISLWRMTHMPARSYAGNLPPLSAKQSEIANRLSDHVQYLSTTIGERNLERKGSLQATEDYLRRALAQPGYPVAESTFTVEDQSVSNLEAELRGTEPSAGIVVVGAHYDSVSGTVGANDNASGVAATLELARLLKDAKPRRAVRFAFFVNEEPPYFQTSQMGSFAYAGQLRKNAIPVFAMLSLETIGYYSDTPGSQKYPPLFSLFYPSRGNFIGFVGNTESRALVTKAVRQFRESVAFPSEGVSAPASLPGIGWSDHWSFWQRGYPAIMITDTAPFRYPYYHTTSDTADKLDFGRMARVVDGLQSVVMGLANEE